MSFLMVSVSALLGVHGIVNARCSTEYPWLLKQGNMQGLGLHDIEMGRIIGTYKKTFSALFGCVLFYAKDST